MSVPATFKDAFEGIRAKLVDKISPSARFLNLMMDYKLLTSEHVEKLQVICYL